MRIEKRGNPKAVSLTEDGLFCRHFLFPPLVLEFLDLMDSVRKIICVIYDVLYSIGDLAADEVDIITSNLVQFLLSQYTARYCRGSLEADLDRCLSYGNLDIEIHRICPDDFGIR